MYNNNCEIRVWSLTRFGSHAIINWIASLFDKPVYFYSRCKPNLNTLKDKNRLNPKYFNYIDEKEPTGKYFYHDRKNFGDFNKYLICRFENVFLNHSSYMNEFFGNSKNKFDVLILREYRNWISSYISLKFKSFTESVWNTGYVDSLSKVWGEKENLTGETCEDYISLAYFKARKIIPLYYTYANEFIGNTKILPYNIIPISFDRWFMNIKYREKIAEKFGLKNNEDTLKYISKSRSSFDNPDIISDARKMDILNRWKIFENCELFWKLIFQFPEVVEISKEVFGEWIEI